MGPGCKSLLQDSVSVQHQDVATLADDLTSSLDDPHFTSSLLEATWTEGDAKLYGSPTCCRPSCQVSQELRDDSNLLEAQSGKLVYSTDSACATFALAASSRIR